MRCLRQSQGSRKNGYEVVILSCKLPKHVLERRTSDTLDNPLFEGIEVLCKLPYLPTVFVREAAHIVYSWWVILKIIREAKPTLVHVHNPPETVAFVTSLVCCYKKIPVVYDIHDGVKELISSLAISSLLKRVYIATGLFFEKITLRKCAGIITVSVALKEAIEQRAKKYIGTKPFTVMRNINPYLKQNNNSSQEELKEKYILFSGTLYTEIIGIEDMVDIIPELHRKTGVRFVIAGGGPYKRKIEQYVKKKGAEHVVEFLGHIDGERLYGIIKNAILCVVPFRKTPQLEVALPNKVFEYMFLGKAIVYPDLRGFSEVLGYNNPGKYSPDDKTDMERILIRLIEDREMRDSAGRTNKRLISGISFEEELSNLLHVYQTILVNNANTVD